jgi:hypothetical protein
MNEEIKIELGLQKP